MNARLVLNATGPWVDHLRSMEDPNAAPSIRLSKGAHLVLKRTSPWKAALATPIDKYRITFALPWEDMLLLGTTDEEYEGDPADVVGHREGHIPDPRRGRVLHPRPAAVP